jgi:hypothetical protein
MMDKNILLDKFSKIFKIDKENMSVYFSENKWDNFEEISSEFEEMRNEVYSFLWDASEKETLSQDEIEQRSKEFLMNKYTWLNEVGFDALKNYIFWISWHDGIMKN